MWILEGVVVLCFAALVMTTMALAITVSSKTDKVTAAEAKAKAVEMKLVMTEKWLLAAKDDAKKQTQLLRECKGYKFI